MAIRVLIVPVGFQRLELLENVVSGVQQSFRGLINIRFMISVEQISLPSTLLDFSRLQFRADLVNSYLESLFKDYIKPIERLVVGLVDGDGYVDGLNFVFGLATPSSGVATVYLNKLVSRDSSLTIARVTKEIVHEIGHLLGLDHCTNPTCVMSFSNSIRDVDNKSQFFCDRCKAKLSSLPHLK
ncbi:MAG: archaemetzincin family Zn-dependent metalloprotease [Desulfurococcales archaeon]|nr:archaemetzincin family Zn-dependent metalloprotease [Desulfurococcales archaeon]